MIYDYRITVSRDETLQQTEPFDHAIIADTNDDRGTVLRRSLEDVDGCVITRAILLSARALTFQELRLLDRTTQKVHPVPGIYLTRRISLAPGDAGSAWPLRILSSRDVFLMNNAARDQHALYPMFPGQFSANAGSPALPPRD
jgi:hypothetical protein